MSELRQNLLDGNWVVISPERGERPSKLEDGRAGERRSLPDRSADCPFCPGNERRFPQKLISDLPDGRGGWAVRLIENKYKIFDDHASCPLRPEPFKRAGIYTFERGCGSHDLVIETPRHDEALGEMSADRIAAVLGVYRDRLEVLRGNANNLIGVVFKNQGPRAGASQPHAHSQIVGSRVVPLWIRGALHAQERYFYENGACPVCSILEFEREAKERVVADRDGVMVLSPYAASAPYEMWIVPKEHGAYFGALSGAALRALAGGLRLVLSHYVSALGDSDYNLIVHSSPYGLADVPYFHRFIQVSPRLVVRGGFEIGTNIPVNPVAPEAAARAVRGG